MTPVSSVQKNAMLHVLPERRMEFARRQAEALAGIAEMARALTRNEGLAKGRTLRAAALQIFSEECAAEVSTHMGSLAAVRALRCSNGTGEDGMDNPWPFRASLDIH
jgi:hypothetical protein